MDNFIIKPVGFIYSDIKTRNQAPRQGHEGEYKAWIEINPEFKDAAEDIIEGKEIIIITWLHKSDRDVLKVPPRGDRKNRLTGVFSTRSPDRPNPLGLHRVKVLEVKENKIKVSPLEAIDKTPVADIKPVMKNEPPDY